MDEIKEPVAPALPAATTRIPTKIMKMLRRGKKLVLRQMLKENSNRNMKRKQLPAGRKNSQLAFDKHLTMKSW